MNLASNALRAACVLSFLAAAPAGYAQTQPDSAPSTSPYDLKPMVPPVFPLPSDSQLNPGPLGGSPAPYTIEPQPSSPPSPREPAPGIRLTIPMR